MADSTSYSEPAFESGESHVAFCNEGVKMRPLRVIRDRRLARKHLEGRLILLLSLVLVCLFPGCTVCHYANQTLRTERGEFNWKTDRKQSRETYRKWADQAWCQECNADPGLHVPSDYVAGFKDGFVDYVYAGGTGQPPPVPPRKFWNVDFRNPNGHEAAADWFAGYRHGAEVARVEGYRERVTVQSSLFLFPPTAVSYGEPPYAESPFAEPAEPLPLELGMPGLMETVPTLAPPPMEELPLLQPLDSDEKEAEEAVEPPLETLEAPPQDLEAPPQDLETPPQDLETPPQDFEVPTQELEDIFDNTTRTSPRKAKLRPTNDKPEAVSPRASSLQRTSMVLEVKPTTDVRPQRRSMPRRHVSEAAWLRDMWKSLPEPGENRRHRSHQAVKPTQSTSNQNFERRTEFTKASPRSGTIPRSKDNAKAMFLSAIQGKSNRRARTAP